MRSLVLAAIVCTVVGSTWVLAEDAVPAKPANQEIRSYAVGDLPVWTKDGKFNPTLLGELLARSVNNPSFDASQVTPYPSLGNVIISADYDTHAKIKDTLLKLKTPTEAPKK